MKSLTREKRPDSATSPYITSFILSNLIMFPRYSTRLKSKNFAKPQFIAPMAAKNLASHVIQHNIRIFLSGFYLQTFGVKSEKIE